MLFKTPLLALLATQVANVLAQQEPADAAQKAAADTPKLDAVISATFPESDVLGVKLVNGRPTNALIEVANNHADSSIQLAFVAGQLYTTNPLSADALPHEAIIRNISAVQYNVAVEAGETKSLPFNFALDMQPQDVKLQLTAVVMGPKGHVYQVPAHNGTATIVDPPTSFFDPQIIFLYLVLSVASAGTLYFVYKTWIEALFPQAKRAPSKGGRKARKSASATSADADTNLSGSEAISTGKDYDESWIPDHHINRPNAKRVKSSAGAKTKKGE